MVRLFATVVVALSVLVAAPSCPASADSVEVVCTEAHIWVSSTIPPHVLELACTVHEGGDPVGTPASSKDLLKHDSEIEGSEASIETGLSEETKQLLLVLLALWSQG